MNCKSVIREISGYIDGDLDAFVKSEIERHLAHCEDCTLIVDQTKKSIEILCNSKPAPLPSDVRNRLRAALRAKRTKNPD